MLPAIAVKEPVALLLGTVSTPVDETLQPEGSVPLEPHVQLAAGQLLAVSWYEVPFELASVVEITGIVGHASP